MKIILPKLVSAPAYVSNITYQNYPRGGNLFSFSNNNIAVYIFYGNENGTFSANPDVTILGDSEVPGEQSYIGYSLAAGDIDGDGRKDLIIGSPFANHHTGIVTVFSSARKKIGTKLSNELDADLVLRGERKNNWFGYHVDICAGKEPLLLVGAPLFKKVSPGNGKLYAFRLDRNFAVKNTFTITSTQVGNKLGHSFSCGNPIPTMGTILGVSAPTKNVNHQV